MKKSIIVFVLFASLFACSSEKPVTITQLFEMPDCSGECYQVMPCEGSEMTIEIYLTGTNVLANGPRFLFVRDSDDIYKTIQVKFDESIPVDVIKKIDDEFDQTVFLRGIIEGFDLLNQEFCKRAHTLLVQAESDIWFEKK